MLGKWGSDRATADDEPPSEEQLARNARLVRGLQYAVVCPLGTIIVLLAIDFRAKHDAERTARAWRHAQTYLLEHYHEDLRRPQLHSYVFGNPHVVAAKADEEKMDELKCLTGMMVYTWDGLLRSYVVRVYLGPGNVPSVEDVDGPKVGASLVQAFAQSDANTLSNAVRITAESGSMPVQSLNPITP